MLYNIILRITYDYSGAAAGGRHIARLMPADLPGLQRLVAGHLAIAPVPAERVTFRDFFGNTASGFAFRAEHSGFGLKLRARVDRLAPAIPAPSAPLARLAQDIATCKSLAADAPLHFLPGSQRAPIHPEMTAYTRATTKPGQTVLQAVLALGGALNRDMRYDPDATDVETPALTAFRARHGVCQDFSHVMIACLRGAGIPAGYVSGFLRTTPPPGKPRLEGADAMHAWVMAWCGADAGWIEYDPTNDLVVGADHIVVARGRDYADVAPIKGILRVSGGQSSSYKVDVIPLPGDAPSASFGP